MSLQSHRLFRRLTPLPLALALLGGVAASAGLAASAAPQTGRAAHSAKPARTPISYEEQIKPLLTARCYACHGNGSRLGDFQLDNRTGLLTGGKTHPVVTPGKASQSYLMRLISGQIPGKVMPARITGTKTRYQRQLSTAIKRARFLALLPYTDLHQ